MNTRISQLFVTGLCIAALAVGIAYSQTSNGDPPDNDIGGNDSPTGVTGDFNGTVNTGGSYDPYTGNAQRTICDITVPGAVGAYPLKWTRFYDSRSAEVGTGIPVGWRHSYQWTMNLNTGDGLATPDGRWLDFNETNVGVPERSGGPGIVLLGDGGRLLFESVPYTVNNLNYTRFRLAQIVDPHGLTTRLDYETTHHDQNGNAIYRLARITEPAGRFLQINYSLTETEQIAGVQAFDAQNNPTQSVIYTYGSFTPSGSSQTYPVLTRVDYSDGTAALYTYQNDNIGQRGSPGIPLLKTCDDVRYGGAMRQIEYSFLGSRVHGQLKSEKKMGTGEAVSTLTFPTTLNAAQTRTETRGDGPARTFTYSSEGRLSSYTDFKNTNPTSLTYDAGNFLGAVKDAMNHETTFTREPNIGQLTRLTHPGGTAHVHFDYSDPNNPYYLTSRRDERDYYTFYDRDGNHRVWQIRYPDGATEKFWYNEFGQVRTHQRRNGAYEHFLYDTEGRLRRAWYPTTTATWPPPLEQPSIWFDYYPSGHPWADLVSAVSESKAISPMVFEYDYGPDGQPCSGRGLVTKITHGNTSLYVDGSYLSFGYDSSGNLLWQENELRQRTTINYDDYNRPISIIPPAPAGPVTFSYEPTFGPPNPYLHTARAVHFQTDGAGVTVENKYDQNFRITSTTQVDGTASPPTTRFEYWPVGTLRLIRDPRDQNWMTSYSYDGRRQLETVTDALNRTTRVYRDPVGNVEWIERPDGRWENSGYDEMNRVRTLTEPLNDSVNKRTTLTYWPSGMVRTVTDDNGQPTMFEYDESDLQTKMTYPDSTYQAWTYSRGKLQSRRTVGGRLQRFSYDFRNRLKDMYWDEGSSVPDWVRFEYDAASQLIAASNQNGTIARQYDDAGRLLFEEQNVYGLGPKTVSFGSDGAGKVTAMSLVGTDYQFAYQYDTLGRFEQILNVQDTPGGVTKSLWYQYLYDAASNETQRFCPMNGLTQLYERDPLGRIKTLTVKKVAEPDLARMLPIGPPPIGAAVNSPPLPVPMPVPVPALLAGLTNLLPKAGAEVPAVGEVIAREGYIHHPKMDWVTNVNRHDGKNDIFGYDYSGQLANASYGQWNGQGTRQVIYSQDALGNRSQVNDNGSLQGYSSNPFYRNQYVTAPAGTVVNYTDHQVAIYQGLSYTYLGNGQLASVTGGGHNYQLSYDAFGRCVKRTLNGETIYYTYDGHSPIYEWKGDGSRAGWNVYGKGVDEILLRAEYVTHDNGQGQGFFFQQNRLGSITHLTGFSGEPIEIYRYDAFGQPTTIYNAGGVFDNRFKFTGREYQANFGIYEYRARAYHPGLGRFLSEDPIGFAAGDTNLFRYCGGDPVNHTDPFGLTRAGKRDKNFDKDGNDSAYYGSDPYPDDVSDANPLEGVDESNMDRVTLGGAPVRSGNAGVPGGLGSVTGPSAGPGGPGSGTRGDGNGPGGARSTGGNGNPYFNNGHFLTNLGKGFQRYNLPAHAAFWEGYANQVVNFIPLGGGITRVGSGLRFAARTAKPTWPSTARQMDDFLKVPGKRIPDTPGTPGRGKVEWRPNPDTKITFEQHPYHPNAPDWHKGPHFHLDTPGIKPHQRYVPGDPIPGY